jgi:hypothetical protein
MVLPGCVAGWGYAGVGLWMPYSGTSRARATTWLRVWKNVSAGLAVSETPVVGTSSAVTTM